MRQCYFWATSSGPINLMKAEDMPVKPERPGNLCRVTCGQWLCQCHLYADQFNEYEAALKAAKASSVPIQDQDKALDIMWRNDPNMHNPISFGNWKHAILKPGTIYGPFTVGYRLRTEFYCQQMNGSGCTKDCEHVPGTHGEMDCFYKDKKWEQVAILYDDTPEKEESQEQDEIREEIWRLSQECLSMLHFTNELKRFYDIKRTM